MEKIFKSPEAKDTCEIPDISFTDYILNRFRKDVIPKAGSNNWVVDILNDTHVKYQDVDDHSKRVASALIRLGFKQYDTLYFVTYESATLHIVLLAVWRLGGVVRGSYQEENTEYYKNELKETKPKFILVDAITESPVFEAIKALNYDVTFISVGPKLVDNTVHFSELVKDDGSEFPATVNINPKEDNLIISSTSGSTGYPKGAIITHYKAVAFFHGVRDKQTYLPISALSLASTFSISHFFCIISSLLTGTTSLFLSKFIKHDFMNYLIKYKPAQIYMYPYVASWFVKNIKDTQELSFIKIIALGGSVIDPGVMKLLQEYFPNIVIAQMYACTECMGIAYCIKPIIKIINDELCVGSGYLLPYVQVKIVEPENGNILKQGEQGEILVKTPYVMKGYVTGVNQEPDTSSIDADGWYHTGDIGVFDDEDVLYVRQRTSFIFKYFMYFVMPMEIEKIIYELESVENVAVVGIPNPECTNLARAFVVLKNNNLTEQEIIDYVAKKLPHYKRLHGGVKFIKTMPMNRGGKTDRLALLKL